jgi:hypothetical protein
MNWTAIHHLMRVRGLDHAPCCVTAEFKVALKRPTAMGPVHVDTRVVSATDDRATIEAVMTAVARSPRSARAFVAVNAGPPGVLSLVARSRYSQTTERFWLGASHVSVFTPPQDEPEHGRTSAPPNVHEQTAPSTLSSAAPPHWPTNQNRLPQNKPLTKPPVCNAPQIRVATVPSLHVKPVVLNVPLSLTLL